MSNAGNTGTRKKNNNAASTATSATAKKARTAKQLAANEASKKKGANAQTWLESHGLKKGVVYAAKYRQMEKLGKTEDEIVDAIRALQVANNATRAQKAAAKTVKKANNKSVVSGNNAKSVATNATGTSKRNIATQRQRNLAKKFKNAGVKWAARALHAQKTKDGKTNEQALDEIKAERPEFLINAPPIPRAKKAATAAVARAPAVVVAANATGAVKGQYICEKCRLVANAPAPSAPAAVANAGNANAGNANAGNATPPAFEELTE